jgi:formylglycine-generating enzyme required for sulfatase activity
MMMNTGNHMKYIIAVLAFCLGVSLSCDMEPPRGNPNDPHKNTDRPAVVTTVPGAGEILVSVDSMITVTFSETVYELSVNHTSFVVLDKNRNFISGKIACDDRNVTFTPHVTLQSGQAYTVLITTGVTDYALNAMAARYEWSFQTAPRRVPETVFVEGGTYSRGSNAIMTEQYSPYPSSIVPEKLCGPEHQVTVSGFHMGKYEVTVEEYAEYCVAAGITQPQAPFGGGTIPVTNVCWYDALRYCNWLSDVMGYERCYSTADGILYTCDFSKNGYRLPTEAEWEYAARNRGTTLGEQFSGYDGANNINDYAWYGSNAQTSARPVGSKLPNALGIHDMSGNVREWCWDWNEWWLWYYEYQYALGELTQTYYDYCSANPPQINPSGFVPHADWPLTYTMRGGSFGGDFNSLRTAIHADHNHDSFDLATNRYIDAGFRICRSHVE